MEWNVIRFNLFQALDSLDIHDIYLIERESNVLTICVVVNSGMESIQALTRMRIIDSLIHRNDPELYKNWLFTYEVWLKSDWAKQRVRDVMMRRVKPLEQP